MITQSSHSGGGNTAATRHHPELNTTMERKREVDVKDDQQSKQFSWSQDSWKEWKFPEMAIKLAFSKVLKLHPLRLCHPCVQAVAWGVLWRSLGWQGVHKSS